MQLIHETELKAWTGCGQKNTLEKWLRENGIKYFINKKGSIVTTIEACNNALLKKKHEEIEF